MVESTISSWVAKLIRRAYKGVEWTESKTVVDKQSRDTSSGYFFGSPSYVLLIERF